MSDQPAPIPNQREPVVESAIRAVVSFHDDWALSHANEICAFLRRRDELGRAKYGTSLQAGNGRDAARDAAEECADLIQYLEQKVQESPTNTRWKWESMRDRAISLLDAIADARGGTL